MERASEEEWRKYKVDKLIKDRKYDRSGIPPDFHVIHQKKVMLDDGMPKTIWMIKQRRPDLRNEKRVIKEALAFYLKKLYDEE